MKPLRKNKYIKVYTFQKTKTITIEYFKIKNFDPPYLVNPDHIFMSNGFQTIMTSENAKETINPLNFSSKYPAKMFEIAIDTKLMKDAYTSMKADKLDMQKVLLFIMIGINILMLYMLMKNTGVI